MGINVCIPDDRGSIQRWEYALSHFTIDQIYVLGTMDEHVGNVWRSAQAVPDITSLPGPLVLLSPINAMYEPGTTDLTLFIHPIDCTYIIGSDHTHFGTDEKNGREPEHKVYIPTDTIDQMYGTQALVVCMWDRRRKGG